MARYNDIKCLLYCFYHAITLYGVVYFIIMYHVRYMRLYITILPLFLTKQNNNWYIKYFDDYPM